MRWSPAGPRGSVCSATAATAALTIDTRGAPPYPCAVARTRTLLALLLALSVVPRGARAEGGETLPLEQIHPGDKGYGLTVFSGFKIERFGVEVIEVLRNFLPKQDLFLIRVDHPVVKRAGVVGGMSGSPIYIRGKLAGALAYGWRFSTEPVAGVTPIADMMALLRRDRRGPRQAAYAARIPRRDGAGAAGREAPPAAAGAGARLAGLPPVAELAPVAVPLSAAGLSPQALALAREELGQLGFEPLLGGGSGKAEGPAAFEPGGSLGVQLVSGDITMAGTGTVTWTNGQQVLGWGHRMLNAGEVYLPATTAKVIHTLSSLPRSFKMSSPARPLGALVQDRQAGVMVDTRRSIGTMPMRITLRAGKARSVYNLQLARHRILTPTLARTVVLNAVTEAMADAADATFTLRTRLTLEGFPPVEVTEHIFSSTGLRIPVAAFSRGLKAIRDVLENEFAQVTIAAVAVDLDVSFSQDVVEVVGVQLASREVNPGDEVQLLVTFRPFDGRPFVKAYPLRIPRPLAASVVEVEVAGGGQVKPELTPPQDIGHYLRNLQEGYPSRALVINLKTPSPAVQLRGHLLKDLPPSVLDALQSGSDVRDAKLVDTEHRSVHATRRIVTGLQRVRVRVEPER